MTASGGQGAGSAMGNETETTVDYLFDQTRKILQRLKDAEQIFLFLDYDGTLTPIVSHPEKAHLSEDVKVLLSNLKKNRRILLAIVSGRSLRDIRNRIGLKGVYYVGNHGFEIFEPRHGMKLFVSKRIVHALGQIRDRLKDQFREVEGILLEDKGYVLAVHYRNVDPRRVPPLLMKLKEETMNSTASLCLGFGKYVFEVRPKSTVNKGVAILELLNHAVPDKVLPIYIGDDQTDEDAFKALKGRGMTIFVGSQGPFSACYQVNDPSEVFQFLKIVEKEYGS